MNSMAARGLAMLVVLAPLSMAVQARLINALLTPWQHVLETLDLDFHVVALQATHAGPEPEIALVVAPARVIVVGSRAIAPDGSARAQASVARGAVWLLLSVYLCTLAAWPVQRPVREGLLRAALGLPLLAVLLLLDVPISLLGVMRAEIVDHLSPGDWDALATGSYFLRGGGRYLVAITSAAALCLAIHRATARRLEETP